MTKNIEYFYIKKSPAGNFGTFLIGLRHCETTQPRGVFY